MLTYFRMKHKEWKIKLIFYSVFLTTLENNKDIIDFLKKTYEALKDTPASELQSELINAIAGFAHDEAQKERDTNE